jgi:hypothetical protein
MVVAPEFFNVLKEIEIRVKVLFAAFAEAL